MLRARNIGRRAAAILRKIKPESTRVLTKRNTAD